MDTSANLSALDSFLRGIWLECCGHLSAFSILGTNYERLVDDVDDYPYEVNDINIKANKVLRKGLKFGYTYDFGDSTSLELSVKEVYFDTKPMSKPVMLLARNDYPQHTCKECGVKATQICQVCMYEIENLFFCTKCSKKHEKQAMDNGEEHYIIETSNSPRMGACAYTE